MKSTSWGKFQIMGFNYNYAGYRDVISFVSAMEQSAGEQLLAFSRFVVHHARLHSALQQKNWRTIATRYNGPEGIARGYDRKLDMHYQSLEATGKGKP